jgi:hypothetical protein
MPPHLASKPLSCPASILPSTCEDCPQRSIPSQYLPVKRVRTKSLRNWQGRDPRVSILHFDGFTNQLSIAKLLKHPATSPFGHSRLSCSQMASFKSSKIDRQASQLRTLAGPVQLSWTRIAGLTTWGPCLPKLKLSRAYTRRHSRHNQHSAFPLQRRTMWASCATNLLSINGRQGVFGPVGQACAAGPSYQRACLGMTRSHRRGAEDGKPKTASRKVEKLDLISHTHSAVAAVRATIPSCHVSVSVSVYPVHPHPPQGITPPPP